MEGGHRWHGRKAHKRYHPGSNPCRSFTDWLREVGEAKSVCLDVCSSYYAKCPGCVSNRSPESEALKRGREADVISKSKAHRQGTIADVISKSKAHRQGTIAVRDTGRDKRCSKRSRSIAGSIQIAHALHLIQHDTWHMRGKTLK